MSKTTDTPLKRFTAFWVMLGAFLLFGILTLIIFPFGKTDEVSPADEASAKRRLSIRYTVEEEQAKNLARVESGDKVQVPPAEIFSLVGSQLTETKPKPFQDEKYKDPAVLKAEAEAATPAEAAPSDAPPTDSPA